MQFAESRIPVSMTSKLGHCNILEPVKTEDKLITKQEIPQSKDSREKVERVYIREENSSDMDFDLTKVEKTPFIEETDPPKVLEVKKVGNPVVLDAPLETHAKALEVNVAEAVVYSALVSTGEDAGKEETETAVELLEQKSATDAALVSAEEKLIAKSMEKLHEEKPATDTVHTVAKNKPIVETDRKIQVEKPATKDDDEVPEEKTATETLKVPEEELTVEELLEEKPTVEAVEEVQEEKSESKIIDELHEGKPATEAVKEVLSEKSATESFEVSKETDGKLAVEAIKHKPDVEPKGTAENEQLEQPASESLQNQPADTEKTIVPNQTVEPAEGLQTETIDHFGKVYETDCRTAGMLEAINDTENKPDKHGQINQTEEKNKDITDENRNFELMKVEGTRATLKEKEKEITANKKLGTIVTPLFDSDEAHDVQRGVEEDSSSKIAEMTLKEEALVVGNVEQEKKDSEFTATNIEDGGAEEVAKEAFEDILTLVETKIEKDADEIVAKASVDLKAHDTLKADIDENIPDPLDSFKDDDNTKVTRDLHVQEVSVKSSPKTPGSMISRVKQSMIKVKRAIIGKSPGSKTPSRPK